MARATFINAILNGKLNGTVYARNKGGAYIRTWVKPTNPRTVAQSSVRSTFTDSSKAFAALGQAIKGSWNFYASTYFKPKRIKQGVLYSGFNAFQSLVNGRQQAKRNLRTFTMSLPATTTITTTSDMKPYDPPPDNFVGNPASSTGVTIPLTIASATVSSLGACTFTLAMGMTNGTAAPVFTQTSGTRKMGLVFFGGKPNSTTSTESICLGFTGFITVSTGFTTAQTSFTVNTVADAAYIANRKMWYSVGQKATVAAYMMSDYGEMNYLGICQITVT
jgi:hypothetical protein